MKTKVDYTKMRRNSIIAGQRIEVCPICSEKGLCLEGQQIHLFMHEGEKTLNGIEVTKFCQVILAKKESVT